MGWSLLHKFHDGVGEVASGAQVTENFDQAREKIEAVEASQFTASNFQAFTSLPTAGATSLFEYTENGIAFPTACLFAVVAGMEMYNNVERKPSQLANVAGLFNAFVVPSGKNVIIGFQNGGGGTLYPKIFLFAVGH